MPRTVAEILAHADELARRFEDGNLGPGREVDGASLRAVRVAFEQKARAEQDLIDVVTVARAEGQECEVKGMNTGIQYAYNLGWKLGQVLAGARDPSL